MIIYEEENNLWLKIVTGRRVIKISNKKRLYPRLIDDKVFKAVFCRPGNEHLLKELTERLLDISLEEIKIISPELTKDNIYEKSKYLDVLFTSGRMYFNYEVFSVYYPGMDNRGFSYIATVYSKALKQGEEYKKMPIVTQINLIAGAGSKKPPKGLDKVVNVRTGTTRVNNLFIIDINLDIICDSCYNEDGRYNFLKIFMASKEELEQLTKEGDSFMKEIKKKMDELSSDNFFENFISVEEDERKIRNTYYTNGFFENFISVEEDERKIRNTYYTNGIEEGEERGKENALIETAKNLLKYGMPINDIVKNTGLSKKKIKFLQ